jgi:hypothetical protein
LDEEFLHITLKLIRFRAEIEHVLHFLFDIFIVRFLSYLQHLDD